MRVRAEKKVIEKGREEERGRGRIEKKWKFGFFNPKQFKIKFERSR